MDIFNFDFVDEDSFWNNVSEDSTKVWDTFIFLSNKYFEYVFYEFIFRRFFDDNGYFFRCSKFLGVEVL